MEQLNYVNLLERRRMEQERETKRARLDGALPQPAPAWRVWLVVAILLIGTIAWWVH